MLSHALMVFLSCSDASTEFVFEETYQTCVMRGVKKILTKAQKTPSKKLKPALTSKRHSCCFSGRCLLSFMTHSFFPAAKRGESGASCRSSHVVSFYFFRTLLGELHRSTRLVKAHFLLICRLHF